MSVRQRCPAHSRGGQLSRAPRRYTPLVQPNHAQRQIETLRHYRNRPARDLSIAGDLSKVREEALKAQRAVQAIGVAWDELVPANIRRSADPVSHVRGVLTVKASDSAARYLFDQWLRAGGLRVLQSAATRTLTRVKII